MRIGIVGSGAVGQSLALGFIKHNYEVMIGTSKKEKYAELGERTGGNAKVGSVHETAKFGEIVVLAVKGSVAELVARLLANDMEGKTVLDVNNPVSDQSPDNGVLRFFTTMDESLMERLQNTAPKANFVKAFNCIGKELMVNPDFGTEKPTMFICGNSENAKKEASSIIEQFGFEVEDMGAVESARAIEPLAMLWHIPGFQNNQWVHALKLLK